MPGASYFELSADRFLFLLVIGMVALISVLIASRTVDANRSSYANLLMLVTLGMNGTLLASDLFSLFVFMEVTGICCFVMIAMFRSRADLEGAFKYLAMSELASIFILSGLAFLFMKTGSLRFDDLMNFTATNASPLEDTLSYVACVLILAGFAIKTGAVPFHSWLPDAHQSADTAVSVLLSGVVIKVAGIYGLLVLTKLTGNLLPIRLSLAFLGIASIVLGALLAFRQRHFKRVVAYSSVSQMGYIMLGLSAGTPLGVVAGITPFNFPAMIPLWQAGPALA
ncbi:MAG TPA: aldehyde dehydrogenase family protein, partial [Clostridia bacterium]|nr:aldehyde dehydrogenase family protein [Clostridia bacterium]